jgi:hypothetical protein
VVTVSAASRSRHENAGSEVRRRRRRRRRRNEFPLPQTAHSAGGPRGACLPASTLVAWSGDIIAVAVVSTVIGEREVRDIRMALGRQYKESGDAMCGLWGTPQDLLLC